MSGKKVKNSITIPQEIQTEEDFKKLCDTMDPKHIMFCDYYMVTMNATDSYRKAGYKAQGRSAENSASRLLGFVGVKKYIGWKIKQRKKKLEVSEKQILDMLQTITKRDITDFYTQDKKGRLKLRDLSKIPPEKLALVDEIAETQWGLRIKLVSIDSGIQKLGAHLGMWNKDKQNSTGGEGTKYIILRYIVPAVGNVMVKPKITPSDIKQIITDHLIKEKNKQTI